MHELESGAEDDGPISLWLMVLAGGLLVLVATFIAVAYATGMPGFRTTQTMATVAASSAPEHLYLSVVTNEGIGPTFVPSSFSIPAGTSVTITVTDYDNDTALPAAYAKVTGTVGSVVHVQPLSSSNPNLDSAKVSSIHQFSGLDVAHTFTVPSLGLNVPLEGTSRTTFTVLVKRAGSYSWHCYDPCGTGSSGWGGPMAEPGYMGGTLTVTG